MSDLKYYNLDNNILHKKLTKIVEALFLVSNIIPESDTLRTKIRNISLDALSLSIAIRDTYIISADISQIRSLERKIIEIISILDVASTSGLVSIMNSTLIKAELDLFLSLISGIFGSALIFKENLSKEFFDELNLPQYSHKDNKDNTINVKDNFTNHLQKSHTSDVFETSNKNTLNRKDQRSKAILDLINKKGLVSIKDISTFIKGCSEKTVQRELNVLIQKGFIKKIGERRWSRYSVTS